MALIKIGITLGDVNGIGPEVALKATLQHRWSPHIRFVLIGSYAIASQQAKVFGLKNPPICQTPTLITPTHKVVLWDPSPKQALKWVPGKIHKAASKAAYQWIQTGVQACIDQRLDALVTAPICKEGFHKSDICFPGHTELLAKLTRTPKYVMMLIGDSLRVTLVTRHIPLRKVPSQLNKEKIIDTLSITAKGLKWLGCKQQKIALCGLNPHAGDGGAIGEEELGFIREAVRITQKEGIHVDGPVSADTIFHKALQGEYNAVVALYHDQGLIPLKTVAFDRGVNITLGLPILRTSPDHGTAFQIAGQNKANPSSMKEAIKLACRLAKRENPFT
ncbi:MAG: 4-hydroxythreonine-4-phosphate dehydrogenase PdxA [Kiritimatiellae bacterium]|nr:4-hydroxythreonine-4-phosphate dehydrogenase PdxA [Kiritimatiellia bacterium]